MKNILLTGHTGFIGNHLLNNLQKNYNIIGVAPNSQNTFGFKQIKKDINKVAFKDIPEKISIIIHLAATSDVNFCQENPTKAVKINIQGTQNILELARKHDSKLIFMSSSHVFGKPKKLPINENHEKHPTSIYSATKLAGESLCEAYSASYGMDVTITRLFSVYGPNSPKHSLINSIITQILDKPSLELGNLKTKRDFVFVSDVVDAIEKIIPKVRKLNDYNIGTGKKTSIFELCTMLMKIAATKKNIKSVKQKMRKNDVPEMVADTKKINQLGWKPKTSLYDGLKLTFEWYLNHYVPKTDGKRNQK